MLRRAHHVFKFFLRHLHPPEVVRPSQLRLQGPLKVHENGGKVFVRIIWDARRRDASEELGRWEPCRQGRDELVEERAKGNALLVQV